MREERNIKQKRRQAISQIEERERADKREKKEDKILER